MFLAGLAAGSTLLWLVFQIRWGVEPIGAITHFISAFVLAEGVDMGFHFYLQKTEKSPSIQQNSRIISGALRYLIFFLFGAILWERIEQIFIQPASLDTFLDIVMGLLGTTVSVGREQIKKALFSKRKYCS